MAVFESLRRRLLASLLRVGGDASPARPRSADSLLASMHRYLRSDLPIHARLYEAFQRLPGHERAMLVEQLESMTQGDAASVSGEVAEMRSHGRGCFFSQEGEDLILSDLFPADLRRRRRPPSGPIFQYLSVLPARVARHQHRCDAWLHACLQPH